MAPVLNSERAITASIQVIQAFVRMRHILASNQALARRIDEVAAKLEKKSTEDNMKFSAIFQELKRLALGFDAPEEKPKGRIGFKTAKEREQGGKAKRKK